MQSVNIGCKYEQPNFPCIKVQSLESLNVSKEQSANDTRLNQKCQCHNVSSVNIVSNHDCSMANLAYLNTLHQKVSMCVC